MFALGKCKKCGEIVIFDIGDITVNKAKEALSKMRMGECPGMHVEIGMITDYYEINWDKLHVTQEEAKHAQNEARKAHVA